MYGAPFIGEILASPLAADIFAKLNTSLFTLNGFLATLVVLAKLKFTVTLAIPSVSANAFAPTV